MLIRIIAIFSLVAALSGCGINNIPTYDEAVGAAWAQVDNQYQRRADLIPNLVKTVKGYAAHEKEVFIEVTEARAKVGQVQISPEMLNNPEALKQYEQAQGALGAALSKLIAVSERYPDLKANENFLQLQTQLEGTENRIAVARRDYIAAVQRYNTEIRTFPGRIWKSILYSDAEIKAQFSTTPEKTEVPNVSFD